MARIAQPLEDYLRDAREDADCALKLLASGTPEDAAQLEAMLPDLAKALTNAAQGLMRRRRSQTAATAEAARSAALPHAL